MTSRSMARQGVTPEDDYGLDAVARHNAAVGTEQFPPYREDPKGLGIYQNGYNQVYQGGSYVQNPPTPRSNPAEDGMRRRSGRSTKRTDSPLSSSKSRVSKSPAGPTKKNKKSNRPDKSTVPKLTAPLSILTKDMTVPVKDIEAWVNRSAEVRQQEKENRNGYVTRPMNSFMLYRSAYAERTKQWCLQNNHQVVSSLSGESWPMEPEEVREQYNEWAKQERLNHQAAHPDYKFSPSKPAVKRRKDFSDEEDGDSDLDANPDGEYRAAGRSVRPKRQQQQHFGEAAYLPSNVGFESHPYYGQESAAYESANYTYASTGRPLPSNVAYDANGLAYNPQTNTYLHASVPQQHAQYQFVSDVRTSTPASMSGAQTIGGYGLPGVQASHEDLLAASRTATPMHQYTQYGQVVYPQYHVPTPQQYAAYHPTSQVQLQPTTTAMYEHQQYLQHASQPETAIDPTLEAAFAAEAAAAGQIDSHFDNAIGELSHGDFMTMPEYFAESTSPNQTLAPSWEPTEALR